MTLTINKTTIQEGTYMGQKFSLQLKKEGWVISIQTTPEPYEDAYFATVEEALLEVHRVIYAYKAHVA